MSKSNPPLSETCSIYQSVRLNIWHGNMLSKDKDWSLRPNVIYRLNACYEPKRQLKKYIT